MTDMAAAMASQGRRTTIRAGTRREPSRSLVVSAIALLTVFLGVGLRSLMPLVVVPSLAGVLAFRRSRHRRWAEHDAQRTAITAFCTALRAELDAGLLPQAALRSAVCSRPELADLAAAANRPGSEVEVPTLLNDHASRPGRRALRALAACWYAADRHGVALAEAVSGIEEGLRAESARLRSAETELAGVRTTIRMLAALPLLGFALGMTLHADPLNVLLHDTIGQISLALGVGLDLVGLLWTDHLVASLRPEGFGIRQSVQAQA